MLDVERSYFEKVRPELESHSRGKFVVIKGEEIVGTHNTIQEALAEGVERFGLDNFLVREVGVNIQEISIPALNLGILSADPTHPNSRPRANS